MKNFELSQLESLSLEEMNAIDGGCDWCYAAGIVVAVVVIALILL
jgi:hypothetical protein